MLQGCDSLAENYIFHVQLSFLKPSQCCSYLHFGTNIFLKQLQVLC